MKYRDSLPELFDIVLSRCTQKSLPLTARALEYVRSQFGKGADPFLLRRLSVCRMLTDLHLPFSDDTTDCLLAAILSHILPPDTVTPGYADAMAKIYAGNRQVTEILAAIAQTDYSDRSYYGRLMRNRYALIIRITERACLVERLYDWPTDSAHRFIRETREHYFPLCLYAKENYPELLGAASILMEKMRNLIAANEILLRRYEDVERSLSGEILALMEENTALRAMIVELQNTEN